MGIEVFRIDESRWPIVLVRWPRVTTVPEVELYFAERKRWLDRRERHALVVDGSESQGLDASVRRRVTDIGQEQSELTARWCAAEAIVLTSAVQRGVLTAIEWVWPPPHPRKTFGDVPSAVRWAEESLARSASSASVGL